MTEFQEVYKEAMEEIHTPKIDSTSVLDGARRKKAKRRRLLQHTCTLMSMVLLLCIAGVTTATASGYFQNVIRVTEEGFVSSPAESHRPEAELAESHRPEAKLASSGSLTTGQAADQMEDRAADQMEDQAADQKADQMEDQAADQEADVSYVEEQMSKEYSFTSPKAFRQAFPDLKLAFPVEQLPENTEFTFSLLDGMAILSYQSEDGKFFEFEQYDYAGICSHGFASTYGDGIANQYRYTTKGGDTYLVAEEISDEKETMGRHAAIAVGDYEIYINFYGYTRAETEAVLDSVDLLRLR